MGKLFLLFFLIFNFSSVFAQKNQNNNQNKNQNFGENFKCPHEYGFYPHELSCDRYWKCENSEAVLKTCGNGLAFETNDEKFLTENCDYLHNVDCQNRLELEPPITSNNCPRLYGIFPDPERCDTFWSCWNGDANKYTCAPGLAYDREARVCMWADQVPECKVTEISNGFKCPPANENPNPGTFSRHAHPEDCRKYYICLDGSPREYGCPIGTVFQIGDDNYSGQCTDPEGVDGCQNYYGDDLKNVKKSELLLGLSYDNNKSDFTLNTKPDLSKLKKIKQQPQQQAEQSVQQSVQPQQNNNNSPRVRQQLNRNRPENKPQQIQTTTSTQKPAADNNNYEDYYYYDEETQQPQQGQQQQKQ